MAPRTPRRSPIPVEESSDEHRLRDAQPLVFARRGTIEKRVKEMILKAKVLRALRKHQGMWPIRCAARRVFFEREVPDPSIEHEGR